MSYGRDALGRILPGYCLGWSGTVKPAKGKGAPRRRVQAKKHAAALKRTLEGRKAKAKRPPPRSRSQGSLF